MALRCLKLLNCPSFQSEFLPPHVPVQDNRTLAAVIERAKVLPARGGDGSDSGDSASQYDADSVRDWIEETASCGPKDVVSVCTLTDTWSKCSWSTILGHGTGDSGRKGPRYKLTHWHYHVKAAESLWAEEERGSDDWLAVYAEIDKFLDNMGVLQVWQKKVLRFRMLDEFDLPIHIASQYGILHYIRRYLGGGRCVDVENEDGHTPLHLACLHASGNVAVKLLAEHSSDVNLRAWKGRSNGETSLWYLVQGGGPAPLVKVLLDHGADASVADEGGWTVLHEAVWAGDLETVKTLLDHGSVSIDEISADKTVLSCALGSPNVSQAIIRLLVSKGADVNSRGGSRCTPLCIKPLR
jgi:hypothetical protein